MTRKPKQKLNVLTLGTYFFLLSVCTSIFGVVQFTQALNNSNLLTVLCICFITVDVFMAIIYKKLLYNSPNVIYGVLIFNMAILGILVFVTMINVKTTYYSPSVIKLALLAAVNWKVLQMTKGFLNEEQQKVGKQENVEAKF